MQIIYISNRPEILNTTLHQVSLFMPFVDEVLVLSPAKQHAKIQCPSSLRLTLLADDLFEDVFSDPTLRNNHVFRNYLLRVKLFQREEVAEEFIMSDDDYRPIRPIEADYFKKDGKYRSFYFYELADWTANATEFDKGQQATYVLLNYFQFPTLCFASHMPQMINKQLFQEAAAFFAPHARTYPVCEWTSYFNYQHKKHQELFHDPEPYQTLAWPELPLIWPYYVKPSRYTFENFYPTLYEAGSIFSELPECPNLKNYDAVNLSKLQSLYQIEIGRLELPYHEKDPLRKGLLRAWLAKLTYGFAILWRRISQKERSDILESKRKLKQK